MSSVLQNIMWLFQSVISYLMTFFSSWQVCAMTLSVFLLMYRTLVPDYFRKWMSAGRFKDIRFMIFAIAGISGLIIYQIHANPFAVTQHEFIQLSIWEQAAIWQSVIHLRSFLCYAAMMFYLWYKWDKFLPAVIATWFGIGLIELTFIPQHFLQTQGFFGLNWYGPFIGSMLLFMILWYKEKAYTIMSKNFWIFFLAGLFVQYFLLLFRPWGLTIAVSQNFGLGSPGILAGWNNAVIVNTSVLPYPPIQTWMFELLNHLMKVLMTIAFCFMTYNGLRSDKE